MRSCPSAAAARAADQPSEHDTASHEAGEAAPAAARGLRKRGLDDRLHGLNAREWATGSNDILVIEDRRRHQCLAEGPRKALHEWFERRKAQIRAIVEHPFHVIKNLFGYRKVSYRGIAKNQARAKAHAALANLYIARRRLLSQGVSASAA